jgi:hypothetical protein
VRRGYKAVANLSEGPYNDPRLYDEEVAALGSLHGLANRYFRYLAEQFPVMCASDEFYFLPRAEHACERYERLDSLDADRVAQVLADLTRFEQALDHEVPGMGGPSTRTPEGVPRPSDLEQHIDLVLLQSSISALRIELQLSRSWVHNPLLYLKIALIGLDHALHKPALDHRERLKRACARIRGMVRLFDEARTNLRRMPELYVHRALGMIHDCGSFLRNTGVMYPEENELNRVLEQAARALNRFEDFLKTPSQDSPLPVGDEEPVSNAELLEATLHDYFRYRGTVSDVCEIGRAAFERNLGDLRTIERALGRPWQELYSSYRPPGFDTRDTLSLYREENDRLRAHFKTRGFAGFDHDAPVRIVETPLYLRSIRSTASFSASCCANPQEESLFYITTVTGEDSRDRAAIQRLHREYRFLTAHETFPGHHLLDLVRRGLENPVRRQVESPLFYEGWASYAESLLDEAGYLEDPKEAVVLHRRNLWRAARCLVDVGMATASMDCEEAARLLEQSGLSPEESRSQIRRFKLTPGYQLCYTIGSHEILNLRKRYGTLLSIDRFHKALLEGGELPFHLIERRFEVLAGRSPDS